MSTVTINWLSDDTVAIEIDGKEVAHANHDVHGWAGMQVAVTTATEVAKALGAEVRTEGTPNL